MWLRHADQMRQSNFKASQGEEEVDTEELEGQSGPSGECLPDQRRGEQKQNGVQPHPETTHVSVPDHPWHDRWFPSDRPWSTPMVPPPFLSYYYFNLLLVKVEMKRKAPSNDAHRIDRQIISNPMSLSPPSVEQ